MNSSSRDISTYEFWGSWSGKTHEIYVYHDLFSGAWIVENQLSHPVIRRFAYKKNAVDYMDKEWPDAKFVSHKAK